MASGKLRPAANLALDAAVEKLKQSLSPADVVDFQSTTLEELWRAIHDIQQAQRDRQSLCNLTRIKPLLEMLEKYSKVIEVLCNGTPYMPWVWAPMKLLLQLASGYQNIFEKLLLAYARIGEALPRFDRYQVAFKGNAAFEAILGTVFSEIADFHRRAYKFFRRRGWNPFLAVIIDVDDATAWHIFFNSLWSDFGSRFDSIIQNLERHRDLIDQEALSYDIVDSREWRQKAEVRLQEREKRERIVQLQGAIAWLAVDGFQEDDLEQVLQEASPTSTDWIVGHSKIKSWMEDDESQPVMWLRGILGAGKSFLSARIVQHLQDNTDAPVLYFFCKRYVNSQNLYSEIVRTLISQLLHFNTDLSLHIYDNFMQKGRPQMTQLRTLLEQLLLSFQSCRIVIDGLDECQEAAQKAIMLDLFKMTSIAETSCKVFFSYRDLTTITFIPKQLLRMPIVCLSTERASLNSNIRYYVREKLAEIQEEDRFEGYNMDEIEESIMRKAGGMFLWAKLVIEELRHRQCISDLREGAENLPEGFEDTYGRILKRLKSGLHGYRRKQAMRILEWVACSYRPLRIHELQDGISFGQENSTLNENTKLARSVVDVCRPLIEVGPTGIVSFVHPSARTFLLSEISGDGIPFLNELQAHHNITFSCVCYLLTSLCLSSATLAINERQGRILKGFHGLHHYAHAFWIEHLLQYANMLGSLNSGGAEILTSHVRRMLAFKKTDWIAKAGQISVKQEAELEELSSRVSILSSETDIHEFIPEVLAFQRALFQENRVQRSQKDLRDYKLEHDPTHFSEILHFYQTTMELFLQPLDTPQLKNFDKDLLKNFQSTYRDSAYICRYRLCPRTCDGFPSPLGREEHEAIHINHLKCRDPSCDNASTAFPSLFALQRHRKLAHPVVESPIPTLRLLPLTQINDQVPIG